MGKPENLTPFEEEFLHGCSEMEYKVVDFDINDGTFSFSLEPDEVCYFEIHGKCDTISDSKEVHELEEKLKTY